MTSPPGLPFRVAYDPARALEAVWSALRREPLTLLLGGLLVFLFDGDKGPGVAMRYADLDEAWLPVVLFLAAASAVWGLAFLALAAWLYAGFARALEHTLAAGRTPPGELFADRDRWWRVALAAVGQVVVALLALVPVGVLALVAIVLSNVVGVGEEEWIGGALALALLVWLPAFLWVMLGVSRARQAAVVEGLGPIAARRRSWSLVRGNRGWLALYTVLLWLVYVSGILLCCVGVVFTATWAEAARIESYLALVRAERPAWWIAGEPARRGPAAAPAGAWGAAPGAAGEGAGRPG
jgi:hypothetical protein